MLRRGTTLQMIELFQMSYDHETGLCAIVDGENTVYLGWNIELHPDDRTGEEYMDWILTDMYDRPERWRIVHDADEGTWSAWKLIPDLLTFATLVHEADLKRTLGTPAALTTRSYYSLKWIYVSRVCRYWRKVALSCAPLWSFLVFETYS